MIPEDRRLGAHRERAAWCVLFPWCLRGYDVLIPRLAAAPSAWASALAASWSAEVAAEEAAASQPAEVAEAWPAGRATSQPASLSATGRVLSGVFAGALP